MMFPETRVDLSLLKETLDMARRILHDQLMGAGSSYALLPFLPAPAIRPGPGETRVPRAARRNHRFYAAAL